MNPLLQLMSLFPGDGQQPANPLLTPGYGADAKGMMAQPGEVPAWFKEAPALNNGGDAKPGAGYVPPQVKNATTGQALGPTAPPGGDNPFTPQFVNTSGVNGVVNGRTVNSPDERLAAMAEQVANRTSANILGTGVNSMTGQVVSPQEQMAAAGLGQDAAKQYMLAGMQGQKEQFDAGQGQLNRQAAAQLGQQQADAHLGAAGITAQGHVQGATVTAAAHTNPAAIKGQVLGQMLPAMFMNPNFDPKQLNLALQAVDQMNGHAAAPNGQAPGFNPVTPKDGAGLPAATGPGGATPPPNAIDQATQMNRATQVLNQIAPLLGKGQPVAGQFQQGPISPQVAAQVLQQVHGAGLSDAEREHLLGDIRAGRLGDPGKITDAVAQATAGAYLRLQPPADPRTGKPIEMGLGGSVLPPAMGGQPQFPGKYDIPGQFSLGVDPNAIHVGGGGLLGGGLPYNQMILPNGRVVRTSPNTLRGVGRRNAVEGLSPQELQILAGVGGQLLPGLAK